MKKYLFIAVFVIAGILSTHAQEDVWQGKSIDFSHGQLRVSANGRYLEHTDKTPFFYLADTAWELFHRLNEQEVEQYLENRRAKGFTVIQAVILAELDGLHTPNANGDVPLKDDHIIQPNEAYFAWVDKVIRIAEAKGLYIGLLPTWGDKVDKQWGVGPEIFNPTNASWYGTWLGRRYKNFKNIIWITGGDRLGGGTNYPIWDAMGKALRKADKNHLITFHPQGERSSSEWFHNCDWLDFNMMQTGHCQQTYDIYDRMLVKDYNRTPVKPTLDGEPRYENHPVCWKPDSLGWFDDTDVRKALYWNLFSGALGHTYGCHDIWQFVAPGREPVGLARGYWATSMDLPGAFDLIHVRRLLERFDWSSRVPAQDMIVSENHSVDEKVVALRGNGFAFVYFPTGKAATLNLDNISKQVNEFRLTWLDPRTGKQTEAGSVAKTASQTVTPPTAGNGNDWVLVIQE